MDLSFDWLYLFLPVSQIEIFSPFLLLIGFSVGVISGFLGIGGAWLVTPGLNILGMPMTYAIGTDMAHMAGKSICATYHHSKMQHVDYKLGCIMMGGSIIGVECGAQVIMLLEKLLIVESIVRWSYITLLILLVLVLAYDAMKAQFIQGQENEERGITWYKKLQKIPLKPIIYFPKSNLSCSLWLPVFISIITGFLAGFLGIGGGLFRVPSLLYFIGCSTVIAVGTDLFEVLVTGTYGAISYSMKGRVDFLAASIMLCGAVVGAQIGSKATRFTTPYTIRRAFTFAVTGCICSLILKQLHYNLAATWMIFSTVGFLVFYILYTTKKRDARETYISL